MQPRLRAWFSKDAQRARWEKTRAKGERHFILWRGLPFGVVMFGATSLNRSPWPPPLVRPRATPLLIAGELILWLFLGWLWGIAVWHILDEKFSDVKRLPRH